MEVVQLTAVFSCSFLDVGAPINKVRTIPSTDIKLPNLLGIWVRGL